MQDYYAILNVLPDADAAVISAAYKALIKKYHPDIFKGDKNFAHQFTRGLNEAYEILSNPEKREQYDAQRAAAGIKEEYTPEPEPEENFQDSDWDLAVSYFPILEDECQSLNTLSPKLAFTYQAVLLESKNFSESTILAEHLKKNFLSKYFGANQQIQALGENLILTREREASKYLNRTISVLGKSADIQKIKAELLKRFPQLIRTITPPQDGCLYADHVIDLLKRHGVTVQIESGFFLDTYHLEYKGKKYNATYEETIIWIRKHLGIKL